MVPLMCEHERFCVFPKKL